MDNMPVQKPRLAYAETSLPVASVLQRIELARRENVALEVANKGNFPVEVYRRSRLEISAVQAYLMHEFHPLHRDRDRRRPARAHVLETLELAAKLGAPRIVTVCGFGEQLADRPIDRAVEFFSQIIEPAKRLGVRVAIEPLSPKRCAALTHPQEIAQLIEQLGEPAVFGMLLDTGHLADSGIHLDEFFCQWNEAIEELQLKGVGSTAPTGTMPVLQWLNSLSELPEVVCVEHRERISREKCAALLSLLREKLATMGRGFPEGR
ncbi:sugar phosphate isomerase/epimerase family protein [Phormidium sp. CCY1219]|uniref:sugar phosphate isomerase/epimerase family protein n=1 Tax=Phormidium sp. CCY1219 TaxID=2886104 RepID=UPI002D1EDDF1|nr:TIM barrel protein [Phormidium sp. CCY1219]MEB3829873.1 sugar phosphate isomerase/epimerase [Phormidium sp. CCY1219]